MPGSDDNGGSRTGPRRETRRLRRRVSEETIFAVPLFDEEAVEESSSGEPIDREESERDAKGRRTATVSVGLVASAVALVAVAAATVLLTASRGSDSDSGTDADVDTPTTRSEPAAAAIGPAAGVDIDQYVSGRQAALAVAEGELVAVVSLIRYEDPSFVDSLVAEVEDESGFGLEVLATLVAAPGGQPEVIRGGGAPDGTGEVVFAIVVRGDASALQRMGDQGEVRLVDVATGSRLEPDATIRGLLPDETRVTGDPPQRPDPIR